MIEEEKKSSVKQFKNLIKKDRVKRLHPKMPTYEEIAKMNISRVYNWLRRIPHSGYYGEEERLIKQKINNNNAIRLLNHAI